MLSGILYSGTQLIMPPLYARIRKRSQTLSVPKNEPGGIVMLI
jgi:hypothetical protein